MTSLSTMSTQLVRGHARAHLTSFRVCKKKNKKRESAQSEVRNIADMNNPSFDVIYKKIMTDNNIINKQNNRNNTNSVID